MDITQKFYDSLASQYDKLFSDWLFPDETDFYQPIIVVRK